MLVNRKRRSPAFGEAVRKSILDGAGLTAGLGLSATEFRYCREVEGGNFPHARAVDKSALSPDGNPRLRESRPL